MSPPSNTNYCDQSHRVCAYAIGALGADEKAGVEAHLATCASCRRELELLRQVGESLDAGRRDVLRPSAGLQERLAGRIAAESGQKTVPAPRGQWVEPRWEEVAPGISCKLLSTDLEKQRVSLLVRLAPGVHYPPHTHAGVEELHLLDGELWIGERKLRPGDYNFAAPGTRDSLVWSETGCTCLLVTSTQDAIG